MTFRLGMKHIISLIILIFCMPNGLQISGIPFVPCVNAEDNMTVATVPVNWTEFWQTFKTYALWDLEWYNGSAWVSVKSDLQIVRTYPEPNWCKFTLIFDASHSGSYRLTFAIDNRVRSYVTRLDKFQYELNYEDYSIIFDWSDLASIPDLIITHGIKTLDGDNYFWFRIRRDNVPRGAHVEIDPAVVASVPSYIAVSYPFQRKGFFANTRFWAFYSDGTNAYYESTTDPNDWSGSAISIGACAYGFYLSVWYDTINNRVECVRYNNYDLFYYCGVPYSNGSISWYSYGSTLFDGSSTLYYIYPCVAVNTGGYTWVGAIKYPYTYYRPHVFKNAYNNGSWSTASGFPYQLTTTQAFGWYVQPVPLTSQEMYIIYCYSGNYPFGKLYYWDGDSWEWGTQESDLGDEWIIGGAQFCAVNEGNDVHFTYCDYNLNIRYNKRTYGVGWGANDVQVHSIDANPALSIDTASGDLYCFWINTATDHIYYKKCIDGTWDANPTDWLDESVDDIYGTALLNSYYQGYGGYLGLLYITKLSSPYNIKFAYLVLVTKQWNLVESWYGILITRAWNPTEVWYGTLTVRLWNIIESWYGELIVRAWKNVEIWFGELITRGWKSIEIWFGVLLPSFQFINLIMWIAFISCILGLLFFLSKKGDV